jgi:hypothetical protein
MAAAAPARTAPAPRTRPRREPAAPARKGRSRTAKPSRKPAPRAAAPSRKPAARATAPRRTPAGGHLIPLAVGRTAVAVRGLPDSGLMVRLTRRRAWIVVLGLLLAGIVALNVATLSFSATAGKIEADIETLAQENSVLRSRLAKRLSNDRVEAAASAGGMVAPGPTEITYREAGREAISAAAQRLAAASPEAG